MAIRAEVEAYNVARDEFVVEITWIGGRASTDIMNQDIAHDLATRINDYEAVLAQRDEAVRLLREARLTLEHPMYAEDHPLDDRIDAFLETVKESKDANS